MNTQRVSVVLSSDATAVVVTAADHTLVRVRGEVDERAAVTCGTLVDLVSEAGLPVQVDLSGVTLFPAAGVSWLVRLYQSEVDVDVVAASGAVREVLDACGIPLVARAGGLPPPRHAGAF